MSEQKQINGDGLVVQFDEARWAQIELLPVTREIGDLRNGLSALARVIYAATGKVAGAGEVANISDALCIAPSIHEYVDVFNRYLPDDLRQKLGARAVAERILAADVAAPAECRRTLICADFAVRKFAPIAFRRVGLVGIAETLKALPEVTNECTCFAANAASEAASNAADAVANASDYASAYTYRHAIMAAYSSALDAQCATSAAAAALAGRPYGSGAARGAAQSALGAALDAAFLSWDEKILFAAITDWDDLAPLAFTLLDALLNIRA